MKFLARLFPYTRRLERDYRRMRRGRRVAEWSEFQESFMGFAYGEILDNGDRLKTTWGKVTFDEIEQLMIACVDYHDALVQIAAADPVRSRVQPIFDKYGVKVLTPSNWNRRPYKNRHLSVITGVTS